MATPKRSKIQREADLAKIAELYLSGHRQADIAAQLDVSQQQVSYDIKELQKRWSNSAVRDLDAAKSQELARIDNLEREYWECWRKSQKPLKSKSVERENIIMDEENKIHKGAMGLGTPGQNGQIIKTVERSEKRIGDTRYLDGVQWCIERRCKILGIDAPTKIAPTNPSGEDEYGANTQSAIEAGVDRLAAIFNLARARRDSQATETATGADLGAATRPSEPGGPQPG